MSSVMSKGDSVSVEAPRRRLSPRQAATVDKLVEATLDELREVGFDGMTVRHVARRAGVASATAYTYFASREHLIAELFWRRLALLPSPSHDARRSRTTRVSAALAAIIDSIGEEPALAAACTVAMLSNDPEVKHLRDRIGSEVHRRLLLAIGDDASPAAIATVEMAFWGALVQAGGGHVTYAELPALLGQVVGLVMRGER